MSITMTVRARPGVDPAEMRLAIRRALFRAGEIVKREARANLTGRVLRVRTGRLRTSITAQLRDAPTASIVVGTNVIYGAIHEAGAPGPWTILPRRARALRFMAGGRVVFAARVRHPGLRPRPWLAPALAAKRAEIIARFEQELGRIGTVTPGGR